MTNEELVEAIQRGDDGLYPLLWEQLRKFIAMQARKRYRALERQTRGCELDDLIQAGYLALVRAARKYTRFAGVKFITFLDLHLKSAFNEALGLRGKRIRTLDICTSLDMPRGSDDGGATTLLNLLPDECDLENLVTESVYNKELRAVLDETLEAVLTEEERQAIVLHYFFYVPRATIAAYRGVPDEAMHCIITGALRKIFNSRYRARLATFLYDDDFNPFFGSGHGNKAAHPYSSSVQERYVTSSKNLIMEVEKNYA